MLLESKHGLFLLQNPKSTIPGSVYQTPGISSLQGRVRKTKHPLGTQLLSPGASSLDTNWPQTNSVLASVSLLVKAGKGEADHACFSRGSQESSEGFGKFLRLENTAGGEGLGRCCAFHSVVPASTFKRYEGPESVFSPCILLSEARGDGWWEDAEPGRLWSLRDWEDHRHVLSR